MIIEMTGFPDSLKDFYCDEKIKLRFDEFGGIIRYVLPFDPLLINSIRTERNAKIGGLDLQKLLVNPNIEDENVSDLIVKVMTIIIVIMIIFTIIIK